MLRRAEETARKHPGEYFFWLPVGGLLFRAGRHEEAVRRLHETLKMEGREGSVTDWLFLAMAHQRLGHAAEARRWLDQASRTTEDVLAALEAVAGDYEGHCRAAREIAAEYFAAEKVLGRLLEQAGLRG